MSLLRQLQSNATRNFLNKFHARLSSTLDNTNLPVVRLRPYQETCLQTCLSALSSHDVSRIGVSLPTGAGKTTVFVSLISRMKPPRNSPAASKALIIVNSVELARQAANQVKEISPELVVEIDQGQKYKASGLADVTVATYQTLLRNERLAKYNPDNLKLVVVDEAHHAAAPSFVDNIAGLGIYTDAGERNRYRRILSHFHPDVRNPDVDVHSPRLKHTIPIIGFSATFSRHDGLALGSVFQKIVYHQDFLSMIKEQWLCNVRFTTVRATIDLSNVTINTRTGEFNPTSLAHVVNTDSVNEIVLRTWFDRASSRRSTLVFCVNLAHLRELTFKFRNAGIDARYVYSGTPDTERKALITDFRKGVFPVLLNVAVLTEGADIPNIDCIIVAKPTRSQNVFAQMIGRGMRLSPTTWKTDCHIIDIVDSTSRVSGVVTTPTLFGLDPNIIVEDETLEGLEERANKSSKTISDGVNADNVPKPTSVTYIDYDNPFALVHDASGAPHVAKMSPYAWVGCGGDVYVLECLGKGYVRIETTEYDGNVLYIAQFAEAMTERSGIRTTPYCRPRKILSSDTIEDAIRGSDKYVQSKVFRGRVPAVLFRFAKWRKEPATDGQKGFLSKKFKRPNNEATSKEAMDVSRLTKGDAANIITRLKHGARARYIKKVREEDKRIRGMDTERRRLERIRVVVGPLATPNDQAKLQY